MMDRHETPTFDRAILDRLLAMLRSDAGGANLLDGAQRLLSLIDNQLALATIAVDSTNDCVELFNAITSVMEVFIKPELRAVTYALMTNQDRARFDALRDRLQLIVPRHESREAQLHSLWDSGAISAEACDPKPRTPGADMLGGWRPFVSVDEIPEGLPIVVVGVNQCCHPGSIVISVNSLDNGEWVVPSRHHIDLRYWIALANPEPLIEQFATKH